MDGLTILQNAFSAPSYPAQPHSIAQSNWGILTIKVQWLDRSTGKTVAHRYDMAQSGLIAAIEQRQMNYFIQPEEVKVWLKHK